MTFRLDRHQDVKIKYNASPGWSGSTLTNQVHIYGFIFQNFHMEHESVEGNIFTTSDSEQFQ